MRIWVILAVMVLSNAFAQTPPAPVGDWQGTLKAGGAELRLVLHITKTDGTLKATIDSVDQPGANGIPVTSISIDASQLSMAIEAIHGTYEGRFNSDSKSIQGTWMQGQPLPLDFLRVVPTTKTTADTAGADIDGRWMGKLDTGALKLRLVFHITGLTATMDSPDQGAKGIPVTSVTRNGSTLILELKQIAGKFEGKISPDPGTIDGTWSQSSMSFPLTLARSKEVAEVEHRRPQDPIPPYPYRSEDVEYRNPVADIQLAGTLTSPKGSGPFTTVLLITGSGQQDRDETLLGHKPFLVLSDYLSRHGIAVLRVDDRGIGKSGGNFSVATTADFATDVEAGVAYLKTRPEVNPHKIGLIGHSEGAVIAPMVAARNSDIAFIVMMAGTGVPGRDIIVAQTQLIAEANGATPAAAAKDAADEREILDLVMQGKDLAGKIPEATIKQVTSPWFRYFIAYDPAPALRKVKCPVLAIGGSKDLQVPPKQNLLAIRKALEEGGNHNIEIDELPGLNHLFQTAKTGALSEYSAIDETLSTLALDKITTWILKQ